MQKSTATVLPMTETIQPDHEYTPRECREIARAEKIFIYFSPRETSGILKLEGHPSPGDWVVAEPRKPVFRDQEVEWQAVGNCNNLELALPEDVFELPYKSNGKTATALVKHDAPEGLQFYEAYVDGQLAIGGSSPGVIVDP